MKDRYLFRGKRVDNGEWFVGYYDYHDAIERHLITRNGRVFEVDPKTIGQCTGLKDKNGTLIFEGDTLRINGDNIGIVVFNGGAFDLEYDNVYTLLGEFYGRELEIIGNVHDKTDRDKIKEMNDKEKRRRIDNHLKKLISEYSSIGTAGIFGLNKVLLPLKKRFDSGERSQELYDEIMDCE